LRVFLVFFFFVVLDTPAGLEAVLRVVRAAAVVCLALCGLNNSGSGVVVPSVTCDLVVMRLAGGDGGLREELKLRGVVG
jgi:hypothetical protein